MAEAIVMKVLFQMEGDGTTIRFSDQGLSNLPGPPQLAYHGPLAEDQTITGDRVQQFKMAAGTLVTVPLLTTDVATTLTVLLPEIKFAEPPGPPILGKVRAARRLPNRSHYNHPGDPHSAVEHCGPESQGRGTPSVSRLRRRAVTR